MACAALLSSNQRMLTWTIYGPSFLWILQGIALLNVPNFLSSVDVMPGNSCSSGNPESLPFRLMERVFERSILTVFTTLHGIYFAAWGTIPHDRFKLPNLISYTATLHLNGILLTIPFIWYGVHFDVPMMALCAFGELAVIIFAVLALRARWRQTRVTDLRTIEIDNRWRYTPTHRQKRAFEFVFWLCLVSMVFEACINTWSVHEDLRRMPLMTSAEALQYIGLTKNVIAHYAIFHAIGFCVITNLRQWGTDGTYFPLFLFGYIYAMYAIVSVKILRAKIFVDFSQAAVALANIIVVTSLHAALRSVRKQVALPSITVDPPMSRYTFAKSTWVKCVRLLLSGTHLGAKRGLRITLALYVIVMPVLFILTGLESGVLIYLRVAGPPDDQNGDTCVAHSAMFTVTVMMHLVFVIIFFDCHAYTSHWLTSRLYMVRTFQDTLGMVLVYLVFGFSHHHHLSRIEGVNCSIVALARSIQRLFMFRSCLAILAFSLSSVAFHCLSLREEETSTFSMTRALLQILVGAIALPVSYFLKVLNPPAEAPDAPQAMEVASYRMIGKFGFDHPNSQHEALESAMEYLCEQVRLEAVLAGEAKTCVLFNRARLYFAVTSCVEIAQCFFLASRLPPTVGFSLDSTESGAFHMVVFLCGGALLYLDAVCGERFLDLARMFLSYAVLFLAHALAYAWVHRWGLALCFAGHAVLMAPGVWIACLCFQKVEADRIYPRYTVSLPRLAIRDRLSTPSPEPFGVPTTDAVDANVQPAGVEMA
eukprot:TRINITY_DN6709_c0_g1_i4.p1 TRINITY_DN6709_c0_g1~~TRINITY_DN6709_c0_g1_i4.p1  ORF type:complete len:801 (-),score=16.15 TRINITY_DN6709_c0_g1_i4:42-2330(-)